MNKYKIPKQGPTILLGNHPNMIIDSLILITIIDRPVRFLIAGVSYRNFFIKFFADCIGAIPVERQQDNKIKGQGRIIQIDYENSILKGQDTKFKSFFKPKHLIQLNKISFEIQEILQDEKLIFKIPKNNQEQQKYQSIEFEIIKINSEYYKIPYIDQKQVYEKVWQKLNDGELICLFPEGGSHDLPQILPLKVGCCIMGLGANQKYNLNTNMIAVGLNYYSPHKFRSKLIVEFGNAFQISDQYQEMYKNKKEFAIDKLINEIQNVLQKYMENVISYFNS